MGQWMSSKEFAKLHGCNIEGLLKSIKRADILGKKFCTLKGKILPFKYTNGIGRGGKVLQIWSEPFKSEAEAEAFLHNYRVDMLEKAVKASKLHTLDSNNTLLVSHNQQETDGIRDVSHTLNMTDKSNMTNTLNMTSKNGSMTNKNMAQINSKKMIYSNTIESNIASIHTEATATMGGVVDSHNSLCGDLHVCDDGGDDACDLLHNQKETDSIRDVTLSLNMTNNSDLTSKKDNMTSGGQCK